MIYKAITTATVLATLAYANAENLRGESQDARSNPWAMHDKSVSNVKRTNSEHKRVEKRSVKRTNAKESFKSDLNSLIKPHQIAQASKEAKAKGVSVDQILQVKMKENHENVIAYAKEMKQGPVVDVNEASQHHEVQRHDHHEHHEHGRTLHDKNNFLNFVVYSDNECTDWVRHVGYLLNYCVTWKDGTSSYMKANAIDNTFIEVYYTNDDCSKRPSNVFEMIKEMGNTEYDQCNGGGVKAQYFNDYPYYMDEFPTSDFVVSTYSANDDSCEDADQFFGYHVQATNKCISDWYGSHMIDDNDCANGNDDFIWVDTYDDEECMNYLETMQYETFYCWAMMDDTYFDDLFEWYFRGEATSLFCL